MSTNSIIPADISIIAQPKSPVKPPVLTGRAGEGILKKKFGESIKNDIIFTQSGLDFVSSMALGAAMGVGVTFSVLFIFVMQGGLTLLAGAVEHVLSAAVVTEMSAIGRAILVGMAVNMLELGKARMKVANMLPAIFLPIAYIPLSEWLARLQKLF